MSSIRETRAVRGRLKGEAGVDAVSIKRSGAKKGIFAGERRRSLGDTEAGETLRRFPSTNNDDNWRYRVRSIESRALRVSGQAKSACQTGNRPESYSRLAPARFV
jgi:hypothetical protein